MGADESVVADWRPQRASFLVRGMDQLSQWDASVRSRWPFRGTVAWDLGPPGQGADGTRLLVRPAVLGFVAIFAIVLGACQPQSPFSLKKTGAWFFGVAPGPGTTGPLFGLVAVFGGLVLLLVAWYVLVRIVAQRPGLPVRSMLLVFAVWVIPLLIAPPLFSRDIYTYAAQGEMMSHHIDPYHYGPSVLGAAPAVSYVDPSSVNAASPYGPLFMQIEGVITSLSLHHELPNLILLRLLALFGVGLMALGAASLARRHGRDQSFVLALALLNPLTLLELVGGAHNDALMLGLLVCGLAVARRGRPVAGVVLCTLAAAIKFPAAIGVVYIGWQWMGRGVPWRSRLRPLVTAGLVAGGVLAAASLLTGLGWSWVTTLAASGSTRLWLSPTTGVGLLFAAVAHAVGIGVAQSTMVSAAHVLGLVAALAAGTVLLLRSERSGTLVALGLSLLLLVALGPALQPWYLAWGVVLLAPVVTDQIRSRIVAVSVVAVFLELPGGHALVTAVLQTGPLQVLLILLVFLAIVSVPFTPPARPRRPFLDRAVLFQLLVIESIVITLLTVSLSVLDAVSHYAYNVLKLSGACALGLFALYAVVEAVAAMRQPPVPPAPDGPLPPTTAIVPAYLPNEAAIIMETAAHHLATGPPDLQVIIAYNTPNPFPVEHELAALAAEDPRLTVLHVRASSSKAENVNAAVAVATGEIIGVFDADHHPAADCYSRAWRWLANGADVVQGRCVVRRRDQARNSLVAASVTAEFEQMYSVGHPGRTRIMGIGLFGGSNGFWRAEALRRIKLDVTALTEDIDASVRLLRSGGRIATDPTIVSGELPPPSLEALCNQRLRWAQGWFQVGRRHLGGVLSDPGISWRRRVGVFWLWGWGTILPWIGTLSIPITIHGWLRHDPSRWSRLIGYILLFGTVSFLLHVGVAFRKAVTGRGQARVFAAYIAANIVFYGYIRVALTRLGHIHEFAGRTEWFVTPRTATEGRRVWENRFGFGSARPTWVPSPAAGALAAEPVVVASDRS